MEELVRGYLWTEFGEGRVELPPTEGGASLHYFLP